MTIEYDFEASVGYWVTISSIAFRRALNEELAPLGITHRQMQVLAWLVHKGEMSQCEMACCMDIEAPTLAGIIDRMEVAGWVQRIGCADDRRKKLLQIKPAAIPVWEQIAECARKVRMLATAGMSEMETDQLRRMLQLVHENLSRQEPGSKIVRGDCETAG